MSLYTLIRETASDMGAEFTVEDVAEASLERVDDAGEALAEVMPQLVRFALASVRLAGPVTPPQSVAKLPVRGSAKVAAIREGWRKRLEEAYAVGGDGTYKRLGDMTVNDLGWLAAATEKQAKAQLARAAAWRKLADLVQAEGVDTVRDLPETVLAETLDRAA